jgi:hypothetical protein
VARLALHAPASWSGKQLDFDDPRVDGAVEKAFPTALD